MYKKLLFLISFLVTANAFAQYPGGINSGLTVWLKANSGVTLTGTNVSQWNDLSGAGITGNFTTAAALASSQNPPPFVAAGINFNPHLAFDKTIPNALASTNVFAGNTLFNATDNTILQVIKIHTFTGTGVWLKWENANTGARLGFEVNNGSNAGQLRFDFTGTVYSPTNVNDQYVLADFITSTTQKALYFSGAQNYTGASATNTTTCVGKLSIGNEPPSSLPACVTPQSIDPYPTTFDVAELIFFNRSLTLAERNKVESYLAVKYGFTLDQSATYANNYTSSNNTVIWTYASNIPFNRNITGIGRDDGSSLSQVQSKSINATGLLYLFNGSAAGTFPATNVTNPNTFASTNSFELFGDNGADTALNACFLSGKVVGMKRKWKMQKTGLVGNSTIAYDNGVLNGNIRYMLVSADSTFPAGTTAVYNVNTGGGKKYATANFSNNDYFTFCSDSVKISLVGSGNVCKSVPGGLITSSVSGGVPPYSYSWNTTPVQTTANATNLYPGTYTLTLTHGGTAGCHATMDGTVVPADSIKADFSYGIRYGCSEDTVDFTNLSLHAVSYTWDFSNGTGSTLANPSTTYPHGTVSARLIAVGPICRDTLSKSIDLNHPLAASFTIDNDTICQGSTVTFTNTSTTTVRLGIQPSYFWDFGDGSTSTADNPSHTYVNTGVYRVKMVAQDFVPCQDSTFMNVYVDTNATASFNLTDTLLCVGKGIQFNATMQQIGLRSWTWTFGDGTIVNNQNPATHAYDVQGSFTVLLTVNYRVCPTISFTKDLLIKPYPQINIGTDTSLCPGGQPIVLSDHVNATNALATWLWSTGSTDAAITVADTGHFYATVTVNGCSSTDSVWVAKDCYLDIPNVFSPNGDGLNDYFFPRQLLSRNVIAFKMSIFNRWGEIVYKTTNIDGRGWDGRFNDVVQPEGVYVYLIDASFGDGAQEHYKGNVTILR